MTTIKTSIFLFVLAMLVTTRACGVKMDGPGEVEGKSTHIVTGTVLNIYSKLTANETFETAHSIAEVRVEEIHKGEGLKDGQLVYVRYWRHTKRIGGGIPIPGPGGHANIPKEGQKVKIGLVKNADNSLDVYHVGGFMSATAAQKESK